jgi:hypothetical protein
MTRSRQLKCTFGLLGLLYGIAALLALTSIVAPEDFSLVLGVPFEIGLVFPLFAAVTCIVCVGRHEPNNFGAFEGAAVAALSYFLFSVLHGLVAVAYGLVGTGDFTALLMLPAVMVADLFFGVILVGWPILIVGALGGALFKRFAL